MDYDLEEFFLRGITKNQNKTVKKSLEATMRGFLLTTVLIWMGFHVLEFMAGNYFNIVVLNLLFFPLIPVALFFSKKTITSGLNHYININKDKKSNNVIIKTVSMLGGILGLGLARFLSSQWSAESMSLLFTIVVFVLLFTMVFCVGFAFYKIKLIKEHCPDLLDRIV